MLRLGRSKLHMALDREKTLQYYINQTNAIMRKMKDDGYRFVVTEGKTKIAWIKVGEGT